MRLRRETIEELATRYERWNRGELYQSGPGFYRRWRSRRMLRRLAGQNYAKVERVLREREAAAGAV